MCGRIEVQFRGRRVESELRGRQGRLLFVYLIVHRHRPVSRDELIEALWPRNAPSDPAAVLRPLLSRLRRALGRDALKGQVELTLELPADAWVDLEVADEAVAAAESACAASSWRDAWDAAHLAVAVASRGFLPGEDAPWIAERQRGVEEVRLRALECLARAGIRLGGSDLGAAERAANSLVEAAPFRETGYLLLMEAYAARGSSAEALRVHDRLRVLLRDELGAAPGADVRALHERLLKGEAELRPPEAAAHTRPRAAPALAGVRPPLPPLLRARAAKSFVGREHELRRLQESFAQAKTGRCRVVVVTGEPGIGKTSIAAELARRAHEDGALVLYGAPDEEPLIAYQPFVDALRPWVTQVPLEELQARTRALGGDLARMVPELRQRLPELPEPPPADPEAERYRLFRAVASLLGGVSRTAPMVLVLDDLQWADESSLLLLKHVVRSGTDTALLIIGGCRDVDSRRTGALADLIADLRRDRLLERLSLEGLAGEEVAALVSEWGGHGAPAGFGRVLQRETEGNPFFIGEVLLHLADSELGSRSEAWVDALESGKLGVPEGVKEVTGRRLARLTERSQGLLELASVVGVDFGVDLLERLSELPEAELVDALEEAAAAQLVNELPGEAGCYAFSHALTRAVLYDGLASIHRARLHGRVGAALEELRAAQLEPHLGELAHHFLKAAAAGDVDKAVDYARRAGEWASSQLAYAEAADYYERALETLERAGSIDERRERELLLSLVEIGSVLGVVGDRSRAEGLLGRVARAAAGRHRDVELHARVERDFARFWTNPGVGLDERGRLAEETIAELDGLGHDLGLASAWCLFSQVPCTRGRWAETSAALERALSHAVAADDRRKEAYILDWLAVAYVCGPTPVSEGIACCERMVEEASSRNVRHLALFSGMGVLRAMRGEFDTARELFRRGARALEELGLEHERAVEGDLGGEIELLAGDPVAAERELDLDRLRMTGVKAHLSDRAAMVAEAVYLQGRYEEAERLTEMSEREAWPEDLSDEVLWRSVRAKALARRGAFEQAERFGREAVALAEETDSIDQLQATSRMDLAEVLILAGRAGEAVPLVGESVELYERKENAVKAARARALLTELAANGAPAATHLGVGSTRQADPRR